MNFKQLVLAAAVMAVPFMAQAGMTSMDDSALSSVTGQDGISISGSFNGSIGKVTYKDSGNTLNLNTITFTGFNILETDPLKIDVVTSTVLAGVEQLQISLPSMVGEVEVASITLGAAGASLGGVVVSGIDMGGTTVKVWGH
jgi:hypothetical protein